MVKDIICTVCPMGCLIHVEGENGKVSSIEGYTCLRGKEYGENEFIAPVRILTSTALVEGGDAVLVPLRSAKPVLKEKLFDAMEEIRALNVKAPVHTGDVLIADVAGTGVDIIATGNVECK